MAMGRHSQPSWSGGVSGPQQKLRRVHRSAAFLATFQVLNYGAIPVPSCQHLLAFQGGNSCGKCKGKGAVECPGCKGSGKNKKNGNLFERWKCFDCQGFGLVTCPSCGKGGLTPEQRGER